MNPAQSKCSFHVALRILMPSSASLQSFSKANVSLFIIELVHSAHNGLKWTKTSFRWVPEWVSEWVSEWTNERSGARKRSEQCSASEWVNGGANGPVLYALIWLSFNPLCSDYSCVIASLRLEVPIKNYRSDVVQDDLNRLAVINHWLGSGNFCSIGTALISWFALTL